MTRERSDVHRPAEMRPIDYRWLAGSYPVESENIHGDRVTVPEWEGTDEWREMGSPTESTCLHAREGQCDHCGARHVYQAILLYIPTGEVLSVGQTCAVQRFGRSDWANVIADGARRAELRVEREGKRAAAWSRLGEDGKAALLWAESDACKHHIAQDMAGKVVLYGALTVKQEAFLIKLWREAREKVAAIERGESVPCPAGKVVVVGAIISARAETYEVSRWASRTVWKCLIEDERGFRVWGTCPAVVVDTARAASDRAYEAYIADGGEIPSDKVGDWLKGMRVTFMATVEPTEKDPGFGTYSRPTRVKVLDGESAQPAPGEEG